MRRTLWVLLFTTPVVAFAQGPDTLIHAVGKIVNAQTGEPVVARIVYESIPYGSRVGVINSSSYSFPLFDREHFSITVEAPGFIPVKYMLDPATANTENNVIRNIALSAGEKPSRVAKGNLLRLNNVIFEVGKSKIAPESFSELDVLVNMMNENADMVIQLEGHTDYLGDARANMKLSEERVESVRDYLTDKGIAKSRVKTKAFGGTQPLSRDSTPEAHRLNRRVEVRILED